MKIKKENVFPVIIAALREDIGTGDVTTPMLFDNDFNVMAFIIAKEDGMAAGIEVAKWVFNAVDERIDFTALCKDGEKVKRDKKVISVKGSLRNILASERVVLNFLGRISGIATLTSQYVKKISSTNVKIFDTRKTMPGLRELDKYAVSVAGGYNHRMGLWDGVLIKDNHLMAAAKISGLVKLSDAIMKARQKGYKDIEVEVGCLAEFKEVLKARPDIIMLDNMKLEDIKKAVKLKIASDRKYNTKTALEVSGGITLENIRPIAKTGVDRISIGCLTHSAPSLDFSLEIV